MIQEFKECKLMDNSHRLCKQNYPMQVKRVDKEPSSCSQRIAELHQTLWTQLNNTEYLYVAP
jgi:hypothetical protein